MKNCGHEDIILREGDAYCTLLQESNECIDLCTECFILNDILDNTIDNQTNYMLKSREELVLWRS